MTTAARPTYHAAVGKQEYGGFRGRAVCAKVLAVLYDHNASLMIVAKCVNVFRIKQLTPS